VFNSPPNARKQSILAEYGTWFVTVAFTYLHAETLTHFIGAMSQSMAIVTAYDTLGEEGLKHSMVQTGPKAIFVDPHLLPKLDNPLKSAKSIEHVIYNSLGKVKQEHIDLLKRNHPHLTIHSFDELRQLGKDNLVDPVPPKSDDLCCIMYTSGSTGTPKGVLLKHRNVVAGGA